MEGAVNTKLWMDRKMHGWKRVISVVSSLTSGDKIGPHKKTLTLNKTELLSKNPASYLNIAKFVQS